MTSTVTRQRAPLEQSMAASSPRLHPVRRHRPGLLIGSVALLAACAAVFANAYLKAGHQIAVLAVTRAVPAGSQLDATDLATVRIAASGPLAPVPVGEARQVIGRRASVALVPGTLLTRADITGAPSIPPGSAVVGVAPRQSQLPAEGIASGQTVDVVLTGAAGSPVVASNGSDPPSLSGVVLAASVLVVAANPATPASGGTAEVSLLVPADVAPVIASASAAGQVALVVVAAP